MARRFLPSVVALACLMAGSAQAESLNWAQSSTYAKPVYGGNPISQGLYVRGCGIYTSNDRPYTSSPTNGIPNSVLRHTSSSSFDAQQGSIVSVDSALPVGGIYEGFYQRVLVEDWFGTGSSAVNSYLFAGVGIYGGHGLLQTYRIHDYQCDTTFELSDTTRFASFNEWSGSITTYKDTIYVCGGGGLHVLRFDPTASATSLVTTSSGRWGMSAWRMGNRIYEVAGDTIQTAPDAITVYIRSAGTLTSVASLQIQIPVEWTADDASGDFKVVKDSFLVDGQKRVRTIGALAYWKYLILLDLSNDTIRTLFDSRDDQSSPFQSRQICDIAVLDRKLFVLSVPPRFGPFMGEDLCATTDMLFSAWDITNPEAWPVNLCSLSVDQARDRGDDGMDTVMARRDSQENPIQNAAFFKDIRNRIQIVRNRFLESGSTGFWNTDGNYSIFANMRATATADVSCEAGGGYPFVHQIVYTPNTLDTFRIGNVNGSGGSTINVVDIITLQNYLNDTTNTAVIYRPLSRYDVNCDGYVNWADLRTLTWFVYQSGQKPGKLCKNCP